MSYLLEQVRELLNLLKSLLFQIKNITEPDVSDIWAGDVLRMYILEAYDQLPHSQKSVISQLFNSCTNKRRRLLTAYRPNQSRQWVIGSDPWPTQKPTNDPVYMSHRFNNHEMHTTVLAEIGHFSTVQLLH